MVLHREQELIAQPDGLPDLRVGGAIPVEGSGQDLRPPAGGRDHCDLGVAWVVEHARGVGESEPIAARRPRGQAARPIRGGEQGGLASAGVHHVDVFRRVDVPVLVACRGERELRPVRRPRRPGFLRIPREQLNRPLRSIRGHDEQMARPVDGPSLVVELVEHPGDTPGRTFLLVLLVVVVRTDPGDERDPGPVGCPGRLFHVLLQVGELARLSAPRGGQDGELHGVTGAIRGEGEQPSVGGPPRIGVPPGAERELAGRHRSVETSQPDVAPVLVRFPVDSPDHVGDGATIRRDPRVAGPRQLVHVLRDHPWHRASSFVGRWRETHILPRGEEQRPRGSP